jgi:hypothetical protein
MRKIISILTLITAVVAVSTTANAQESATGNGTTTTRIVAPIKISTGSVLNFGDVAAISSAATVTVSPAGLRSQSDNRSIPVSSGTKAGVSNSLFTVSGEASYTYAITLPTDTDVTLVKTGETDKTMLLTAFTSLPAATGVLDGTTGSQELKVGATLNVGIAQATGNYTAATGFDVTVNYN